MILERISRPPARPHHLTLKLSWMLCEQRETNVCLAASDADAASDQDC